MLLPKVPATRPQPLAAPSSSASRNQKEKPSPAFLHILLFSERGRASSRGVNPNAPVVPGAVSPSLAARPRGGDGCRGRAGQRRGSLARALLCPVPCTPRWSRASSRKAFFGVLPLGAHLPKVPGQSDLGEMGSLQGLRCKLQASAVSPRLQGLLLCGG